MKKIQSLFGNILFVIPYLIVFVYSLYQPSDPDLGWHLKYGEYFWKHGNVLRDNTFATMMPNFHWADTSWITDIISYAVYHIGGLFGLSLLGALVVVVTFYFFAKAFGLSLWQQTLVFPFVLYLEDPINAVSFRGQQLALLCIGVLFYLISLYEKKPKILWLSVPLFVLWAGFDGEFILGYALFGLWVILYLFKQLWQKVFGKDHIRTKVKKNSFYYLEKCKEAIIEERKEIVLLLGIVIASLLATIINPFGYGIHLDALSHIGNPLLKDINEYLPFNYLSSDWWNEILVGIILIFGLFIFGFQGKILDHLPTLGGGLVLFLLSLQIRRYAWPSYYLVFPLFAMTATFLKPDGKKVTKIATTVLLLLFFLGVVWLRYPFTKFTNYSWNDYCLNQVDPCSSKSAEYIIQHKLTHNLFSLYGWGGFLIWNYPQIKPSIDGRMHLWVENGYSAFSDYYSYEQNVKNIDKTNYDVVYMTPNKPLYSQLLYLVKIGKWKLVYHDRYAGIFVRIDR